MSNQLSDYRNDPAGSYPVRAADSNRHAGATYAVSIPCHRPGRGHPVDTLPPVTSSGTGRTTGIGERIFLAAAIIGIVAGLITVLVFLFGDGVLLRSNKNPQITTGPSASTSGQASPTPTPVATTTPSVAPSETPSSSQVPSESPSTKPAKTTKPYNTDFTPGSTVIPDKLVGEWRGRVREGEANNLKIYPVEVLLTREQSETGVTGKSLYRTYDCQGELVLINSTRRQITLRETITDGSCITTYITIEMKDRNSLKIEIALEYEDLPIGSCNSRATMSGRPSWSLRIRCPAGSEAPQLSNLRERGRPTDS